MITIIFLDENNETVSITFTHTEILNEGYVYGVWDIDTNEVYLNDNGWSFLHEHRKDIRKLKPMMDKLDKRLGQNAKQTQMNESLKEINYYPICS